MNSLCDGKLKRAILQTGIGCAIAVVFLLGIFACNEKEPNKKDKTASLVGTWANTVRVKEKPVLTINSDGTYVLSFEEGKLKYPGKYNLDGSTIQVTDFYCGKALPGAYLVSISNDNLTFKLVDDPKCDRNRFFPEPWKRVK